MEDYKKKYEEALENFKKIKAANKDNKELVNFIEYEYPELKESEDEKIRKECISIIDAWDKLCRSQGDYCEVAPKCITWLEKQGKKDCHVILPTFTFDDILALQCCMKKVQKDEELYNQLQTLHDRLHDAYWLEKQGEQNLTRPVWKYKKDNTPLLRDSFILNKYGCVGKSPSGALVSDVWVLDFDELAKLPKEEFEGQSEQKSIDKVEPKFKVGDWVVWNGHIISHIDNIYEENTLMYTINTNGVTWTDSVKKFDAIAHLWTIQDAKDGDVLANDTSIIIFRKLGNDAWNDVVDYYVGYNHNSGKIVIQSGKSHYGNVDTVTFKPATKEQRDLLFSKMKESGYEWDAEKKELKKIESVQPELPNGEDYGIDSLYHAERILEKTLGEVEGYQSDDGILEHKCAIEAVKRLYKQKPAWSEEDEEMIEGLNNCLDELKEVNGWLYTYVNDKDVKLEDIRNWLKSFKERMKGE